MYAHFTIYVVLIVLPALLFCDVTHLPSLNIEMDASGFHRDLLYTVQFDYPLIENKCEYVIQQTLPAAIYISVDQLDNLVRLKKLNAIYPKFVDVEIQTEKAAPFTVLLKGVAKNTDSIKLPIHFRYHKANDKSAFVVVDIQEPTMYISCLDNDLRYDELQVSPNEDYCIQENGSSFVVSKNEHYTHVLENCGWRLININYKSKLPLRAKIPVGNEKALPPILLATILVSWIVSFWTIYNTHSVPQRINYNLNAQRTIKKDS